MSKYAADTAVPPERSRAEIERMLIRYGATAFQYGWEDERSAIGFKLQERYVRILLPMPVIQDFELTESGRMRTETATRSAYDQAVRQRWRALGLIIKAKLEAIESGITTLEREFLADVMLPNGQTAGQWLEPQIAVAYERGQMPPLLPGGSSG
jgi:hypothetical protein